MAAKTPKTPPLPPLRREAPHRIPEEYHRLLDGLLALTDPIRRVPPKEEGIHRIASAREQGLETFPALEQAMRRRSWNMFQEHLMPLLQAMFILNPEQAGRLQAAAPEELRPLAQALPELNGLLIPNLYESEHMRQLLQILGSLPTTPLCALGPDWRAWFLLQGRLDRSWRPYYPSEAGPSPLETQLAQLTAALLTEPAAADFPGWGDLARELKARPWQTRLGATVNPDPDARRAVPLTEVMTYAKALHQAGQALQLKPEVTAFLKEDSPEAAAAAIQKAGVPLSVDLGTLSLLTPERLRELLNGPEPELKMLPAANRWHRSPQPSHAFLFGGSLIAYQLNRPDPERIDAERLKTIGSALTPEEIIWGREALPEDPRRIASQKDAYGLPAGLGALARQWRTTPQALQEYLEGKRENLELPEKPALCPMTKECPGHCAALQEAEPETAFPLTFDGSCESCGWFQFQRKYQDLPPELRGEAARQQLTAAGYQLAKGKAIAQIPTDPATAGQDPLATDQEPRGKANPSPDQPAAKAAATPNGSSRKPTAAAAPAAELALQNAFL